VLRPYFIITLLCLAGCAGTLPREQQQQEKLSNAQLLEVAHVLEQSGDTVRAEQYLHAALKQGADEAVLVPHLLRLYASDGQYRLAIEYGEHYLRRHPKHRAVRLFLAALYTAVGADTLAAQAYERVLIEEPNNAEAHFALASLLYESGRQRANADTHFRAYLALDPQGDYAEEARSLLLTELP
jgi:Tfp pilus assembly protein PilF